MGWRDTITTADSSSSSSGAPKGSWRDTIQQVPEEGMLQKAGRYANNVLEPIETGINYVTAPVRQALDAPYQVASGKKGILQAGLDVPLQLARGPSTAPSYQDIAEHYGVPHEQEVPETFFQPMGTYSPSESMAQMAEGQTRKISPSGTAATLADLAVTPKILEGVLKPLGMLAEASKASPLKEGAGEIRAATEAIGTKPTKGMLSTSPYLQNIESSLEQSPTLAGQMMRKQTGPVRSAVSDTANKVFENISQSQPSEVGTSVKQGLISGIRDKLAPISESFDRVRESTEFIDANPNSLKRVANNIRSIDTLKSSPGNSIVNTIAEDLEGLKNVDDIKSLRSNVGKRFASALPGSVEKATFGQIYGKLSSLEENTMLREALKQARTAPEGAQIGKELVTELKQAKKDFKGLLGDLTDIGQGSKLTGRSPVRSVEQFIDRLESVPDEDVINKMWKTSNRDYLMNLQKFDQTNFEKLRQGKLSGIYKQSLSPSGELDPNKLLRNVKDIEPKTRELLFGAENTSNLENVQKVIQAFPQKIGPSGTPQGLAWSNYLSPTHLVKEAGDLGQYGLYNANDYLAPISNAAQRVKGLINSEDLKRPLSNERGAIRIGGKGDGEAKGLINIASPEFDAEREALRRRSALENPGEPTGKILEPGEASAHLDPERFSPLEKTFYDQRFAKKAAQKEASAARSKTINDLDAKFATISREIDPLDPKPGDADKIRSLMKEYEDKNYTSDLFYERLAKRLQDIETPNAEVLKVDTGRKRRVPNPRDSSWLDREKENMPNVQSIWRGPGKGKPVKK